MNGLKAKLRTKSFWVSLAAGAALLLQTLGVQVDAPYVNEIVEAVCAVLVLLGIFTAPAGGGQNAQQGTAPTENSSDGAATKRCGKADGQGTQSDHPNDR